MSRTFLINQSIGEYRIVDFLGVGGMGEVYRAMHSKIGRVAAVKVLTQTSQGGDFVERFFNEARIQASLQHPNIATLYDFCEVNGQPCIIMEYVDGQTLAERICACGSLSLSETIYIFQAIVESIEYIHRHGIIHRDIKSNNVKLSSSGHVKLLDFGIAKGQMSPGLTQTGSVVGTLHYLSPEQIRGGIADQRGDIWALGVLLYEMNTGRVPFDSETLGDLCDKIARAAYTPPAQLNSGVPSAVSNIIARCLKKNPADRYQSAQQLLQDVRKLASSISPPVSTDNESDLASANVGRKPLEAKKVALLGGAAVTALGLLLAGIVGLYALSSWTESATPGADSASDKAAAATSKTSSKVEERTIELHLSEGRAGIYRDGSMIGTTPFTLKARLGERVKLTLKREGYADEPVDFTVSEKKVYTFNMTK